MDTATVVMQRAGHRVQRVLAAATAGIASAAVVAACGGSSIAQSPAPSQTPAVTQTMTPDSTPTPATTAAGPSAQQLIAVAQQVYLSNTGSCEKGNPSAPSVADYSGCPFTPSLAERLAAAQQAQLRPNHAGGGLVLCHCQAGPTSYTASNAVPSSSGGTVQVVAAYCCGSSLTFTLTVVSQQGQLLVDDIVVQAPDCGHPEEIDAASC
jgi:hypothetical protein